MMPIDLMLIGGLLALIIIFMTLYIISKSQSSRQEKELQKLKAKVAELSGALHESKESEETNTIASTSFTLANIEKIERLEEELHRQKQRVQEAKSVAQEYSMVKYEFLSHVNHEIRTPLNSILAFAELLHEQLKEKKNRTYAQNITNAGRDLLALMDNVIKLSDLEAGRFELELSAVDLRLLFTTVVEEYKKLAQKSDLDIFMEIDETLPTSLILDAKKVQSILYNLIENAIKFTERGSVTLRVFVRHIDIEKNTLDLEVIVEDTGKGIEPENIDRIFNIFQKRDYTNPEQLHGSGIELSINHRTAQLMNGDIKVSSVVGKGSSFRLELYELEIVLFGAEDEIDQENIDFSLVAPKGANVMVVDEDIESADIITDAFDGSAVEVYAYDNPRDAIAALQSMHVDMIFMDFDILSVDDSAVSKMIAKISDASVVTLLKTSLKDRNFSHGGAKIAGHLKKPLSLLALFNIAIKELNFQELLVDHHDVSTVTDIFTTFNQSKLDNFIKEELLPLEPLFSKVMLTRDLSQIKSFAKKVLTLALEKEIKPFVTFATKLLEEITVFNIEAINSMLNEYESLTNRVKNL